MARAIRAGSPQRVLVAAVVVSLLLSLAYAVSAPIVRAAIDPAAGCAAATLAANDDESTGSLPLGFTADFFGTDYTSLFVNNNGNVTFTGPLAQFTPSELVTRGIPIIAPFWADVDTRGAGSSVVGYGSTTFESHSAFCVNWDGVGVGYFASHADKLNKFQLLLVDRSDVGAGDFDIVFNYDQVLWETGDASGGTEGLGGSSARAGYSNGNPATPSTSFELPGSAVNGAFLDSNATTGLIHNSRNSTVSGRYIFSVRNGTPQPVHMLTIDRAGAGSGTVTSDPAGIDCGETCAAEFDENTVVTLTATADPGSEFVGWSDCAGTGACEITMDADHLVTATFDPVGPASSADLAITNFTDAPDPVTATKPIRYTIDLTNFGPDPATNVSVAQLLPAGASFLGASDPSCAETEGHVDCSLGTLEADASRTLTIDVAAPSTPGSAVSDVNVSATEPDPDTENNSASATTEVQSPSVAPDDGSGFATGESSTTISTSSSDPVQFSRITVPVGVVGEVVMHEENEAACSLVVVGVRCIGERLDLDAPSASANNPLVLEVLVGKAAAGKVIAKKLVLYHLADDALSYLLVPPCMNKARVANPAPSCVSSIRNVKVNGVAYFDFTVYTTVNGSWRPGSPK